MELWAEIDTGTLPAAIHIVPFDYNPTSMEAMLNLLGKEIDCFVGPCDSLTRKDLNGETLMLVKHGDSPILNKMRDEIETNHTSILLNAAHFYDTSIFNE